MEETLAKFSPEIGWLPSFVARNGAGLYSAHVGQQIALIQQHQAKMQVQVQVQQLCAPAPLASNVRSWHFRRSRSSKPLAPLRRVDISPRQQTPTHFGNLLTVF